jgi:uncharacterized protein (TIGR04551 family)
MSRSIAVAACLALSSAAVAQQDPAGAPAKPAAAAKQRAAAKQKAKAKAQAQIDAEKKAEAESAAAPAPAPVVVSAPAPAPAPLVTGIDPDEFRRQVMDEVRKELAKTKEEVKQETSWVEADSTARVQDSEAVEKLKQSVNLFQPHGYFRVRYEFFNNMNLERGADPAGYTLFPNGFIGSANNKSISDANMRFRFDPTLMISEDIQIHTTMDILDNVLLGSSPQGDPVLDQYTPLNALTSGRAGVPIAVKRVWGRVNTQLGEFTVGRMGYNFGLGILHNDGNGLDQDYGDTYDRVAFSPREFKGHRLTAMMDILDKGASTTGEYGSLGRSVDLDTLDDGYRLALEVLRVDTLEEARRKLDAGEWVLNYGATVDYRVQGWDTPGQVKQQTDSACPILGLQGGGQLSGTNSNDGACLRSQVVQRSAKLYQPDAFFSVRKDRFKLELEVATTFGNVGNRATTDAFASNGLITQLQPLQFGQVGAAIQSQLTFLPADALIAGLDAGGASGDKGVYGFGARPWRSGSQTSINEQPLSGQSFYATAPGDIDGPHFNAHHGHINNFVFNRAFNVDMILWRNLVSSVTSAWYVKPSLRYRPTGRKGGGGDDTGFEITAAFIYSQAWYDENTPGLSKPLGLEGNFGVSYDTSDKLHVGVMYGILLPLSGLSNSGVGYGTGGTTRAAVDGSIAHAVRAMVAMPF